MDPGRHTLADSRGLQGHMLDRATRSRDHGYSKTTLTRNPDMLSIMARQLAQSGVDLWNDGHCALLLLGGGFPPDLIAEGLTEAMESARSLRLEPTAQLRPVVLYRDENGRFTRKVS